MKQITQHIHTGKISVSEVPQPAVQASYVLVRVVVSCVSPGTERAVHNLAKKNIIQKARARPDLVAKAIRAIRSEGVFQTCKNIFAKLDSFMPLGYSCAGNVIALGEDVGNIQIGDRVACIGSEYAQHAEVVSVPAHMVVSLPKECSYDDGSLAALGAIALQGIRRANLLKDESVAVVGLGIIGQLTLHLLRAYGHPVLGIDLRHDRIADARLRGFDAVQPDQAAASQRLFDAVIITAAGNSDGPLTLAADLLREHGRVVAVGDVPLSIPRRPFYEKELDFFISRSYGPGRYDQNTAQSWSAQKNAEEFLRVITDLKIELEYLYTMRIPLSSAPSLYEQLSSKQLFYTALFIYDETHKDAPKNYSGHKNAPHAPIRIGIIGAGSFAQKIILPFFSAQKNAQILAIATKTPITAATLKRRYPRIGYSCDENAIYENPLINLVIIATPHSLHAQEIVRAWRAGKAVYVEKPLCINREELAQLASVHKELAPTLFIGYNRRHSPYAARIRSHMLGGPVRMLYRVSAGVLPQRHWISNPLASGGRMIGEGCHFIDLMSSISQSLPITVTARKSQSPDPSYVCTIEFENGSIGSLIYETGGHPFVQKEYLEVHGSGRSAMLVDFKKLMLYSGHKATCHRSFSQQKGFEQQFSSMLAALAGDESSHQSFAEIERITLATFAAEESAESKCPVSLL